MSRTSRKCNHPPLDTFIAFKSNGGSRVWRCSHCGREDVWRDGWQYFGPLECLGCGGVGARAVLCSDACRRAFKPPDPRLALEIAAAEAQGPSGRF